MYDRDFENQLLKPIESSLDEQLIPDNYEISFVEAVRQALGPYCGACRGEDIEHTHWIKSVSYDYGIDPNIKIQEIQLSYDPW